MSKYPIVSKSDIVIFGSSSCAVDFAEGFRARGFSVFLFSDLPYWGAECSTSNELPAQGGQLRPLEVKQSLDRRVLAGGFPFLLQARPVALLNSENGKDKNLFLAFRTSTLVIQARIFIDLSPGGLIRQLSGENTAPKKSQKVCWRVLGKESPTAGATWKKIGQIDRPDKSQENKETFILQSAQAAVSCETMEELLGLEFVFKAQRSFPGIYYSFDNIFHQEPSSFLEATQDQDADVMAPFADEEPDQFLSRVTGRFKKPAENPDRPTMKNQTFLEQGSWLTEPAFVRHPIDLPALSGFSPGPVIFEQEVDVLVAGGGTGGASAAISAARQGARVLALETQGALGGVGTVGVISSYWFGNRVGHTAELDKEIDAYSGKHAPRKGGTQWLPEDKASLLMKQLRAAGGEAWLRSFVVAVRRDGRHLREVLVSTPFGLARVKAQTIIDATGNADLAAAAGQPCRLIQRDHLAVQGTGISPREPETHYLNSDHTFVDDNDPVGVSLAFINARLKFPDAFDIAPFIDSRERRQIRGRIELKPEDLLMGRSYPDTVYTARSNFDTHGFTIHPLFQIIPPDKKPLTANVPWRCMLTPDLDNLVVIGLGMSAQRDALPVIRMQADIQNQGYATGWLAASLKAGEAAALADLKPLQEHLLAIGGLAPDAIAKSDEVDFSAEQLRRAAAQNPLDLGSAACLWAAGADGKAALEAFWLQHPEARTKEAALLLAHMKSRVSEGFLIDEIRQQNWDQGWNYRGMHQFGRSSSPLDDILLALAQIPSRALADIVLNKAQDLGPESEFSHYRAVTEFALATGDQRFNELFIRFLNYDGFSGNVLTIDKEHFRAADNDLIENHSRNISLREITLARGLFLLDDEAGVGESILNEYQNDIRGVFARHAKSLLEIKNHDAQKT